MTVPPCPDGCRVGAAAHPGQRVSAKDGPSANCVVIFDLNFRTSFRRRHRRIDGFRAGDHPPHAAWGRLTRGRCLRALEALAGRAWCMSLLI